MPKKATKKSTPKPSAMRSNGQAKGSMVEPLADRVLIKPLGEDELGTTTASGIIIPDTIDKEKPEQGRVVAVGPGRYDDGKLVKPAVKIGDRVVFSKYGYDEISTGGEDYLIIKEDSILAVIK